MNGIINGRNKRMNDGHDFWNKKCTEWINKWMDECVIETIDWWKNE